MPALADRVQASRITLWGQSAGAASTDFHNFAFYEDPIVTGFFGQSGTALLPLFSYDTQHTNFSFVAEHVGCNHPSNPAKELSCMRALPWETIEDFVGGYSDNGTMPALTFAPSPDDKIIFANYTDRYAQNKVSQRPAIFSNAQNEGNGLTTYHHSGINITDAVDITCSQFIGPSGETSKLRTKAGLKTYRSLFSGNFSNVSPLPWMGSYHSSDLPMYFATHQDYTNGEGHSTPFEFTVSQKMEDLLYSFMLDPEHGPEQHGWAPFSSGEMLRFGADGKVVQNISVETVDGGCYQLA